MDYEQPDNKTAKIKMDRNEMNLSTIARETQATYGRKNPGFKYLVVPKFDEDGRVEGWDIQVFDGPVSVTGVDVAKTHINDIASLVLAIGLTERGLESEPGAPEDPVSTVTFE